MSNFIRAAEQFWPKGTVTDIREFGSGNINKTFLVTLNTADNRHAVLQLLNTQIFRHPELIINNLRIVTRHVRKRLEQLPLRAGRRWEMPALIPAIDGRDFWQDKDGSFWRAITFIEGARSFDTIKDADHAREVGYALGMFHFLLSDLPPDRLSDTLDGFHITPRYLKHYDAVLAKYGAVGSPEIDYCLDFVSSRKAWAHVLEDAKAEGRLIPRTIHGDPKVNNIMIDSVTGTAVSMVDLDTVKPGLVHYDIGDCLRSGCNPAGEETEKLDSVRFEPDICRAILRGYLPVAREFLTDEDFHFLFEATRVIAFELGLRFFTDHLEGDVYFRVRKKEHNLVRALVQFRLTESIESRESAIRSIIREMR